MSSTILQTDESRPYHRECRHPECGTRGPPETFATTDYCSEACKTRHEGRDLLATIVRDHRYCGNCARQLKDVTGVPPEWFWSGFQKETALAFVGYQFRRPEAATGERERGNVCPPVIETGTVCGVCGATDLSDPVPWNEHGRLIEAAGLFCDALVRETDATVDYRAVLHTLIETRDLEFAIGRGVSE